MWASRSSDMNWTAFVDHLPALLDLVRPLAKPQEPLSSRGREAHPDALDGGSCHPRVQGDDSLC